jgi:release factor glutamine methyltransferase
MSEQETKKSWDLGGILDWSTGYLAEKGFENPRLNVEWLLCHVLNCKRIDLYAEHDRPLSKSEIEKFKTFLLRRVDHEPLQYIVGSTEFMGLPFEVTTDVLIPRPDTECLVEATLEICKSIKESPVRILDIGTGSGAVAISVAYYLRKYSIPFVVTALDISGKAIAIAKKNSEKILGGNGINFAEGNILDISSVQELFHSFDVIVSNPPYVSDKEFEVLPPEVKKYEPALALKAKDDGLEFYKKIAERGKDFFHSNLSKKHVILEVAFDQAPQVRSLLVEKGFDVTFYKDFQRIDRVVCGSLS